MRGQPITTAELIGTWKLLSAVQHFDDGTKVAEFGASPRGVLSYAADGTVTAVLGASDRPRVLASDPQGASDQEYTSSARRFIAYTGTYTVDDDTGHVLHHIDLSLFPNWEGASQLRLLDLDGDIVTITASPRTTADGRVFHSELRWRRTPR